MLRGLTRLLGCSIHYIVIPDAQQYAVQTLVTYVKLELEIDGKLTQQGKRYTDCTFMF